MVFLKILKKIKQNEKEQRILLLGLDNSGKSSILNALNNESLETVTPTVGFCIKTTQWNGYKLNIWDIGGQKTIRSFWRNYFEQTDGVIWVVDSSDDQRIEDCIREFQNILLDKKLFGKTILIFANKSDLSNTLSISKISKLFNLNTTSFNSYHIIKCSAVTKEGLNEGLTWLVDNITQRTS